MNHRTSRYYADKFQKWKGRVRVHIPRVTQLFYQLPERDRDAEKQLGRVIRDIADPYFSILHENKRIDEENRMAFQIILEMDVEQLFARVGFRRNAQQPQ